VPVGQTADDAEDVGSSELVPPPALTCDVGPLSTHITWNELTENIDMFLECFGCNI